MRVCEDRIQRNESRFDNIKEIFDLLAILVISLNQAANGPESIAKESQIFAQRIDKLRQTMEGRARRGAAGIPSAIYSEIKSILEDKLSSTPTTAPKTPVGGGAAKFNSASSAQLNEAARRRSAENPSSRFNDAPAARVMDLMKGYVKGLSMMKPWDMYVLCDEVRYWAHGML